jgi:hypothetical protein
MAETPPKTPEKYVIEWTDLRTKHTGTTQVKAISEEHAAKEFKNYCHNVGMFNRKIDFIYPKSALRNAAKKRL